MNNPIYQYIQSKLQQQNNNISQTNLNGNLILIIQNAKKLKQQFNSSRSLEYLQQYEQQYDDKSIILQKKIFKYRIDSGNQIQDEELILYLKQDLFDEKYFLKILDLAQNKKEFYKEYFAKNRGSVIVWKLLIQNMDQYFIFWDELFDIHFKFYLKQDLQEALKNLKNKDVMDSLLFFKSQFLQKIDIKFHEYNEVAQKVERLILKNGNISQEQ